MASFVEQLAHTTIPTHFHAVNQVSGGGRGQGTLGKRAVHPWTVHYTNGFTGYGPRALPRPAWPFSRYGIAGMQEGHATSPPDSPLCNQRPSATTLWARCSSAVKQPCTAGRRRAIWSWPRRTMDWPPGSCVWAPARTHAPDPAQGRGQYLLVAEAHSWHDGAMWPRLSCLYVSADTGPFVLQSGTEGLEALLLQFPVAEASAVQPGGCPGRTDRPTAASARRCGRTQAVRKPWETRHGAPGTCSPGAARGGCDYGLACGASRRTPVPGRSRPGRGQLAWRQSARGQALGAILEGADLVGADLQHVRICALPRWCRQT